MTERTFERRRLRVYIAGPISNGDRLENVVAGMRWAKRMLGDGLAPYLPHLDAYLMLDEAASWNALLEWDLEWLAQAEAVFRIAGDSKGADLECEVAESLGIPLFWEDAMPTYRSLLRYAEIRSLSGVRR